MQFRGVMCLVHLDEPKMGPTSMELTKFYPKLELRRALLIYNIRKCFNLTLALWGVPTTGACDVPIEFE